MKITLALLSTFIGGQIVLESNSTNTCFEIKNVAENDGDFIFSIVWAVTRKTGSMKIEPLEIEEHVLHVGTTEQLQPRIDNSLLFYTSCINQLVYIYPRGHERCYVPN
ncbi:MAG: hypothetical protein V4686_02940 [Patescibacteria group bacterium]